MAKRYIILIIQLTIAGGCFAQDIHFSDFYSSTLNLNPATTGDFIGNYRYDAVYRWQYGTVTVPYQTFSISADVKNDASRRKALPLGYGVLINYDFTGDSRYTSYQFGIPVAYHYVFHKKRTKISYGLLPQLVFNQLDFSKLQFPDQFISDMYNQNVDTKDKIPHNKLSYFNLSTGINGTFITSKKSTLNLGFNLANITKPSLSFFSNSASRLDRRYSFMTKFQYRITATVDIVPTTIFQFQGALREYQFGGKGIVYLDNMTVPLVSFGAWYRSRQNDAIILHFGFNMDGYLVGFNYDINVSQLATASNGIGAFEVSILYIYNRSTMPHKFQAMKCPTHL